MLNIQSIGVLQITKEFIETTCATEFTEDLDFMLEFSNSVNKDVSSVIKKIKAIQNDQNVWNLITDEGVSCKAIQVWVYYVLSNGLLLASTFSEKERALLAAQLYFVFLTQPGSDGSQFYHSSIYEKSLATFEMIATQNTKSKEKKAKSQDQDHEDGETILTTDQQVSLVNTFNGVLKDFCRLLSTYSLKSRPNEIKRTVEALVLLVKSFSANHRPCEKITESTESDLEGIAKPNQLALRALQLMVNLKHGKVEELSMLVFRLLMTTITMRHASTCGPSLPRAAVRRAEAAMELVAAVYQKHGSSVAHSSRVLMQNIIAQCPERMEYRHHVSEFASTFIAIMPIAWYADFITWLKRFANHSRIGYRLAALSLINRLLLKPERTPTDDDGLSEDAKTSLTHKFILETVVLAVSDCGSSIRAKALNILADVMEKSSVSPVVFNELLQSSFTCTSPPKDGDTGIRTLVTPLPGVTPLILNSVPVPSLCLYDPTSNNLLSLISKCSLEMKCAVRKSSVLVLEAAICKGFVAASKDALEILSERSRDPLLSVRKCAIQAITNVLQVYPDSCNARFVWMDCLLPSISDRESSMQEKASQLIEEKILSKLLEDDDLPWKLLSHLTTEKGNQNRIYLQKVAKEWNVQGKLKKNVLEKVLDSLEIDKRKVQAWMLLSIFTLFTGDKETASHVFQHWARERQVSSPMNMQIDMISTAGQAAKFMDDDDKDVVLENLKARIESGRCSIQLVGYVFEAIYNLVYSDRSDNVQTKAVMDDWCNALLAARDTWFSDVVIKPSQCGYDVDLLINHLYVVGEASQRCCGNLPKRLLLSIQALLTNTSLDNDSPSLSQPLSQFGDAGVPPSVRAHAIFNLGRICFHDEVLAKKFVPALSRELATCDHEEVRSNALVILTDLCVLQTQLVDPFLHDMANCLGDKSVTVRKHAIVLLSSLLQREYVKWKEALLFKFLYVSCDDCEEVKSLARHFLLKQLLNGSLSAGNLFYRNFVPCLFYYNVYEGHKFTSGCADSNARGKKLFDLSDNFKKRMEIYEFVLQNMEDQHRINLTGKLCTDVLEAFVEGTIPLKKKTQNLLTDTLSVLCCKDIRLRCLRAREDTDPEDLESNNPTDQLRMIQNAAKHKVILQTVKTNLVENIIPIIIALKNMLFDAKSPLVKNVMLYLKEVMKEYRKEVQVILSADKQLASEIEFDLKRFDAEQEQAAVVQRMSVARLSVPGTPTNIPVLSAAQALTTPATLKRKKRPMNVQAILHSARKVVQSPKPGTSESFNDRPALNEPLSSMTPVATRVADLRAASTPQTSTDINVTFARDISAIITTGEPSNAPVVLLACPEKTPPPATWNVTSPAHTTVRKSVRRT